MSAEVFRAATTLVAYGFLLKRLTRPDMRDARWRARQVLDHRIKVEHVKLMDALCELSDLEASSLLDRYPVYINGQLQPATTIIAVQLWREDRRQTAAGSPALV